MMKKVSIYFLAVLFIGITLTANAFIIKKHINSSNKGFAVIELFTSEGCSSCPPADAVVARIEKESAGEPVYILAFHVDYWNRLGWKDVFSSAAFSERQHQYARWLHSGSVYTPQVIVNGKTELVGSEEGKLRGAIKASLQNQPALQLTLSNIKLNKNRINLHYETAGNINNSALLLVLVQKSAQSKVERGENAGRTLSHVQIVRSLQSIPLKENNGTTAIALPKGFDAKGYELIACVQNCATGNITAASRSAL